MIAFILTGILMAVFFAGIIMGRLSKANDLFGVETPGKDKVDECLKSLMKDHGDVEINSREYIWFSLGVNRGHKLFRSNV